VKGNSVKLIGENASYNLKLTKNGEIVVSKGRYFFKNMLVYKKNYFKHK
jgi:predicted transcriptional regulator